MKTIDNKLENLQRLVIDSLVFDSSIECSKYKGVKEIREELRNKNVEETYKNISKVLRDLHKNGLVKRDRKYDAEKGYSFYFYARKLPD